MELGHDTICSNWLENQVNRQGNGLKLQENKGNASKAKDPELTTGEISKNSVVKKEKENSSKEQGLQGNC